MPKGRKGAKDPLSRLARLPRRADLVVAGGKRLLGLYVREGEEAIQSEIVIWLNAQSGAVLASKLINPHTSADGGISDALETLVEALNHPAPLAAPPEGWLLLGALSERLGARSAPPPQPRPGLPATLLITDDALAQAAQALFAPLHVAVEYQPDLPIFEQVFQSLAQHLGAQEDARPPEPFTWDIPQEVIAPLYAAAAAYWRRAPWEYLPDHPPVTIELGTCGPQPDVQRLYASILGLAGEVIGVSFYYSLDALERHMRQGEEMITANPKIDEAIEALRQSGAPTDLLSPEDLRLMIGRLLMEDEGLSAEQAEKLMEEALVCLFDRKEDCDPTYLAWMKARKLKAPSREGIPLFLRTSPGQETREPTEREAQALTLALEALNQFFTKFGAQLDDGAPPGVPLTHTAQVSLGQERVAVPVSFTPTEEMLLADDWLEEAEEDAMVMEQPEEPASEAGRATVYRFQVRLQWMRDVWRRVELTGDLTLHHLHLAIQQAFDWDDDHLYAFYLSGKAWDRSTAYESPYAASEARHTTRYRLEHLPLKQGQRLLYIFDFGDDLRHEIKLEAILPGKAVPDETYPRITERQGKAPPQYPNEEGEEWEEEDEDGDDD